MLTDADLGRLNRLVADELAAGRTPADALQPLTRMLDDSCIRSQDLEFGAHCSPDALPNHLLLCSQSGLWSRLSNVFPSVSGTGAHYNGMFGHGAALRSTLRDNTAASYIEQADQPPAPISEQVLLCVRILGTSQVSLHPDVASAVRRHLSEIMLTYPVLLHPAILLPVLPIGTTDQVEYRSLASTLATSVHGALPRYSHFRSRAEDKAGGTDPALTARLAAFAAHPCVRLAFSRAATRVRQNVAGTTLRDRQIKFGRESLARSLVGVPAPRVEFLASVMEIDDLLAKRYAAPTRPFWSAIEKEPALVAQMDASLAASIAAASGLVHVAAMHGALPDTMRAFRPDPAFLADIRRRHDHLFGESPLESGVGRALIRSAQRRIFLSRLDDIGPGELAHNTRNLAMGLASSGLCPSVKEAAKLLVEACVGSLRPDGNLPKTDTTGAVAFLHAIESVDGLGDTDEAVITTVERIRAQANSEIRPFMDGWVKAAEVFATERVMTSVILRVSAEAKSAQTPTEAATPDTLPSRRRLRAAI